MKLSNDISKRLMLRFKRSKDFNKLIKRLEKEGYYIKQFSVDNKKCITISKDKDTIWLVSVMYEDNADTMSEYKQSILAIYY